MRLIHTITVVAIFHEAFFGNATWPTVKHAEADIVRFPTNVEVANVPLSNDCFGSFANFALKAEMNRGEQLTVDIIVGGGTERGSRFLSRWGRQWINPQKSWDVSHFCHDLESAALILTVIFPIGCTALALAWTVGGSSALPP